MLILFLSKTSWYQVFKSIHVLAAVVWLGGGAMITVLAWRAQRAKDYGQLLQIGKQAEWLSTRVFVPASLVVLAMGIVLMHKGDWGYGHFWTLFGLIAWGVSFVVGAGLPRPRDGQDGEADRGERARGSRGDRPSEPRDLGRARGRRARPLDRGRHGREALVELAAEPRADLVERRLLRGADLLPVLLVRGRDRRREVDDELLVVGELFGCRLVAE